MVTVFRELRGGKTDDGKTKLKSPSGDAAHGRGDLGDDATAWRWPPTSATAVLGAPTSPPACVGAVVKDPVQDRVVWLEYLETVVKERDGWKDLYRACRDLG